MYYYLFDNLVGIETLSSMVNDEHYGRVKEVLVISVCMVPPLHLIRLYPKS
jgi:hypothetical protein